MTAALPAYRAEANTCADLVALERSLCDPQSLSNASGCLVLQQGAHWRRNHEEEGAAIARNHMPVDTGAPCLARGTQADVLVQERCHCSLCGLRSNLGWFTTTANPT